MAFHITVREGTDLLGWMEVFAALGVKRYRRLLRHAGVPTPLTTATEGLDVAAHSFWESIWRRHPLEVGPRWDRATFTEQLLAQYNENFRQAVLSLLEETFALLIQSYGEPPARELYGWAERHFVDREQAAIWGVWNRLFLRLINESSLYYPLLPPRLPARTLSRAKQVIRHHLPLLYVGDDGEEGLAAVFAEVERIPLSAVEQRMIAVKPAHPDDPHEIDLSTRLKLVIQREAAYQIWNDLHGWLEGGEHEVLLGWGREQAELMGDAARWVMLPSKTRIQD